MTDDASSPLSFRSELHQTHIKLTSQGRIALAVWRRHYELCEAFDRRICTGPVRRDGITPATGQELATIGRHARRREDQVEQALLLLSVTKETSDRMRAVARDEPKRGDYDPRDTADDDV